MYNPAGGDQTNEYLELYNTTASDVDLNGWCFTAGITLCFTTGQLIAAHDFVLISPNSSQTLTTYGVTPLATYTGSLDNGGERITLQDASHVDENSVKYNNKAPWPTTPAGTGPSLELKDPNLDNTVSTSWAASTTPTPGATNSAFLVDHADIENVSHPTAVTPSQTETITASVTNTSAVSLIYKVNFDSEQTLTMYDDGAHGDGASGDNVYGATIPGQAAGQLVRYKVSAAHNTNTSTKPGTDDTINYYGYAVQNSAATSQLPILQWFIDPADYASMTAHPEDPTQYNCVVVVGDTVVDNTKVDVYGQSTRSIPKLSLEFQFPAGYKVKVSPAMDRAVKEFKLEADGQNLPGVQQALAWKVAKEVGLPVPQAFALRLQRNGNFHGVFTFVEKYNQDWRQANNMETGAFYKQGAEKKTRLNEDRTDINTWFDTLSAPRSASRRDYLLDNQDIPETINWLAFQAITRNYDWNEYHNMYQYRDTDGTGRWIILLHDLDLSYNELTRPFITPYDADPILQLPYRGFAMALYDEPDLREMYFRRLRTLADAYYSNDQMLTEFHALFATAHNDLVQDFPLWYPFQTVDGDTQSKESMIMREKNLLLFRFRKPGIIPTAQSEHPVVTISHINTDAGGQDEYIQLTNNSTESIDMSGWKIDEINYTVPPGAVLLAGHSTVLVKDDLAYHTHHPGSYVAGQYPTSINTNLSGTLTLSRADNSTSSSYPY